MNRTRSVDEGESTRNTLPVEPISQEMNYFNINQNCNFNLVILTFKAEALMLKRYLARKRL